MIPEYIHIFCDIVGTKATGGLIAGDLRGGRSSNKKPQRSQGAPEQLEQITGMKSLSQFVWRQKEKEREIRSLSFNLTACVSETGLAGERPVAISALI